MAFKLPKKSITEGTKPHIKALKVQRQGYENMPDGKSKSSPFQKAKFGTTIPESGKSPFTQTQEDWQPAYEGGDHSWEDLEKMSEGEIRKTWPDVADNILKDLADRRTKAQTPMKQGLLTPEDRKKMVEKARKDEMRKKTKRDSMGLLEPEKFDRKKIQKEIDKRRKARSQGLGVDEKTTPPRPPLKKGYKKY